MEETLRFCRELPENRVAAVMLVPPLSGPARKVVEFYSQMRIHPLASLCWTSDSTSLVVSASLNATDTNRLLLVSVDTRRVSKLSPFRLHLGSDLRPGLVSRREYSGFLQIRWIPQ